MVLTTGRTSNPTVGSSNLPGRATLRTKHHGPPRATPGHFLAVAIPSQILTSAVVCSSAAPTSSLEAIRRSTCPGRALTLPRSVAHLFLGRLPVRVNPVRVLAQPSGKMGPLLSRPVRAADLTPGAGGCFGVGTSPSARPPAPTSLLRRPPDMSDISKCNQAGCDSPPMFRFTWPGHDEAGICAIHAVRCKEISAALGMHLQMIPLTPEEMLTAETP